jgi:hypothetical protein
MDQSKGGAVKSNLKCPGCGADRQKDPYYKNFFKCGSNLLDNKQLNQSNFCNEHEKQILKNKLRDAEIKIKNLKTEIFNLHNF